LGGYVEFIDGATVNTVEGFAFARAEGHDDDLAAGAKAGGGDGETPAFAGDFLSAKEQAAVVM
jgi:hypothetical protein